MANNQDDLLSDIDLSSLAQVWSMLNPVNRLQQEMGEDAPDILGGPGLLADAATGPVGGLRGLGSLLKKFTHEAGSGRGDRFQQQRRGSRSGWKMTVRERSVFKSLRS